jgi:hypothetical protein
VALRVFAIPARESGARLLFTTPTGDIFSVVRVPTVSHVLHVNRLSIRVGASLRALRMSFAKTRRNVLALRTR